jgi:hypothetical protein
MPFKLKYDTVYIDYLNPQTANRINVTDLNLPQGTTGTTEIGHSLSKVSSYNVFESAIGSTGYNQIGQLTSRSLVVPNGETGPGASTMLWKAHSSIYMFEDKVTIDFEQFLGQTGNVLVYPPGRIFTTPGTVNTLNNKYPIIKAIRQRPDPSTSLDRIMIGKKRSAECSVLYYY